MERVETRKMSLVAEHLVAPWHTEWRRASAEEAKCRINQKDAQSLSQLLNNVPVLLGKNLQFRLAVQFKVPSTANFVIKTYIMYMYL